MTGASSTVPCKPAQENWAHAPHACTCTRSHQVKEAKGASDARKVHGKFHGHHGGHKKQSHEHREGEGDDGHDVGKGVDRYACQRVLVHEEEDERDEGEDGLRQREREGGRRERGRRRGWGSRMIAARKCPRRAGV